MKGGINVKALFDYLVRFFCISINFFCLQLFYALQFFFNFIFLPLICFLEHITIFLCSCTKVGFINNQKVNVRIKNLMMLFLNILTL